MKNIGILGSTGSVGTQALEIIRQHPDQFNITFLSAYSNIKLLRQQSIEFNPEKIHIYDTDSYNTIKQDEDPFNNIEILSGNSALLGLCSDTNSDIIINAISGFNGLQPTIKILESGIDIALANKESIVQAGHLVMKLANVNNAKIFPVDSEHSAIWQCLMGENVNSIKKIILTASGGPFRRLPINDFAKITKKQALNHPNWVMGNKITIDSATMMNKGFEFIEAFWLFNVSIDEIEVVIHPQSIIHSMVEFIDGSIKAQLSSPDMRLPIQMALTYPERYFLKGLNFNFNEFSTLTFEKVDFEKFKCIKLAKQAIKAGGSYPTVLNVTNDLAVDLFLNDKISFIKISELIEESLNNHEYINNPSIDEIKDITNLIKNTLKG